MPTEPFIVRPDDFAVIDGDTIQVLSQEVDERGKRIPSFSVRMRSIEAPERAKRKSQLSATDILLRAMGREEKEFDPGSISHEIACLLTRQRCIMILPGEDRNRDEKGRLIGDVYISGLAGKSFSMKGSFSLERVLLEDELVTPRADEDLPAFYLRDEIATLTHMSVTPSLSF